MTVMVINAALQQKGCQCHDWANNSRFARDDDHLVRYRTQRFAESVYWRNLCRNRYVTAELTSSHLVIGVDEHCAGAVIFSVRSAKRACVRSARRGHVTEVTEQAGRAGPSRRDAIL
ncbi:hypothetical protein [Mycolicibacterium agri]|uniref:hypothetical protein n=1 Tax=Mycolicibacterium agri TaxID=36811 RepID=UPI0010555A27|nr:hypothetical protein [Mycolicibacterium agri]